MAKTKQVVLRSEAPASTIDPEQTLKASKALLAHMKKASKEKAANAPKKNLLADADNEEDPITSETPVWLTLTTKRYIADAARLKPGKIVLPHSLNTDEESSICLITADPQRAYKNLIASEEFPEALRTRVTRVVDLGKLKSKWKTYEAQRKLFAEHDIFLGDERIINQLPKVLGKTFYKSTAKRPIPVDFQARRPKVDGKRAKRAKSDDSVNACKPAEMAKEIEKALGSALVHLTPSTQTAIRVGYASMKPEQIAANIDAVVKVLVEKYVPQQWKNVKGIFVKGPETTALPIWQTDELWLDGKDIVADGSEEAAALLQAAEKPNVGKKRKSLEAAPEEPEPVAKKAKKGKKEKAVPESNDDALDKEIAERKAKLKKQKAAAKKAMDA